MSEKDSRFDARLSKEQKELFENAAKVGGYSSLSDFVIMTVQEKAMEIIKEHDKILKSEKDVEVFFEMLTHPPAPNEYLKRAWENYEQKNS